MKRAILPSELSITEYARITGKPRKVIQYRVKSGQLPSHKVGVKYFISLGALEEKYPVAWGDLLKCWGRLESAAMEDEYDS